VRKVWRQIMREGFSIARCTLQRLMPEMGLGNLCAGGILGGERRQPRVFAVMPSLWGMN